MSTTMTLTMREAADVASVCPNCGIGLPHPSSATLDTQQQQIEDLQAQVRLLTQKATAAVDKWADYEDEIQQLRNQTQGLHDRESAISSVPFDERSSSPSRNSSNNTGIQNRLSQFLTSRKSTPNLKSLPALPNSAPSTPSTNELVEELRKEQSLRVGAEKKLDEASGELEELSAQLFMQANEMVATERKARAKLEERVEVLEKRDGEKRKRLERLEGAVQRIERVRNLLAPGSPS